MSARLKRIEKAQMRVLFTVPFFAPGVAKLPNVVIDAKEAVQYFGANPEAHTACTNGETIMWTETFVDKCTDAELVTVLCHEVCHCMLGHLWRAPAGADWDIWNQATDHAVNLMLKDFSAGVMAKRLADPFPFPKPEEAYCANPAFKDMAEEVIYQRLASQKPPGGNGGSKGRGKGGNAPGTPGQGGSMPAFGQMTKPNTPAGATKSTGKQLQNDWEATLLQAAKLAGNLPGNLERLIEGIINPKVDWAQVLRSWLREQCADDWTWQVPALEFDDCGFILPSLKSEKMGPVVFGSDWSGSTFGELVEKFHAEKQGCLDDMRPSKLVDIGFDTRVLWQHEYTPGDLIDRKIAGGGGTCFIDVLKKCEELNPPPKCVVILTDLEGTFPKQAPPFPVIWVAYGTKKSAPFGDTIYAD